MKQKRSNNFDAKSIVVGALLAASCGILLGASRQPDTKDARAVPLRFLILESKPFGTANKGYQAHLLTLAPHYGKIDQDSLQRRFSAETQKMTAIITTEQTYGFRRGDILGFALSQHLRLTPGSSVTRQLPSGRHETVTVSQASDKGRE